MLHVIYERIDVVGVMGKIFIPHNNTPLFTAVSSSAPRLATNCAQRGSADPHIGVVPCSFRDPLSPPLSAARSRLDPPAWYGGGGRAEINR